MSDVWVLLVRSADTAQAVKLLTQVDKGPRVIEVDWEFRPEDLEVSLDLEDSAERACQAVYPLLVKEGDLKEKATVVYDLGEKATHAITGPSADLALALGFAIGVRRWSGHRFRPLAATGRVEEDRRIGGILGLGPKLKAALAVLPTGSQMLYPRDNEGDVPDVLRQTAEAQGVELIPVGHLYEALARIGMTLTKVTLEPFRGLEAYRYEDASVFFGRGQDAREIADRVKTGGVLLVVGASGSGKSSLVQAGVVPELVRNEGCRYLPEGRVCRWSLLRPRDLPRADTAADSHAADRFWSTWVAAVRQETALGTQIALPESPIVDRAGFLAWLEGGIEHRGSLLQADIQPLWVIDQVEEVFTLGVFPAVQDQVGELLQGLKAAGHWVLLTLRNDFFAAFQAQERWWAAVGNDGQYTPPPLDAAALEQMIQQPANLAECTYEVDAEGVSLATRIREDLGARPSAALPLLGYTLRALYTHRTPERRLTYAAYAALGRLQGAIGQQAERLYQALQARWPEIQAALPGLIRALTTVEEAGQGEVAARPAALARFPEGGPARALIEAFRAPEARLLVTDMEGGDGLQVRVAHEAFLTHWERARDLIEQDRPRFPVRDTLKREAKAWHAAQDQAPETRAELLLPEGQRLAEALALQEAWGEDLEPEIRDYIHASRQADQARQDARRAAQAERERILQEKLAAEEAALREAQIKRRRTQVFAGVASGLLLLALLLSFGIWQALGDKQTALDAEVTAKKQVDAQLIEGKHNIGLALLEKAKDASNHANANAARLYTLHALTKLKNDKGQAWELAENANPFSNRVIPLAFHASPRDYFFRFAFAYSPDGKTLAIAASRLKGLSKITQWDLATGQTIRILEGHKDAVTSVAFSPDGKTLASGSWEGTIRLWNPSTGRVIRTLEGHTDNVSSVAFSPNGKTLASGSWDGTIRLWNTSTGRVIQTLEKYEASLEETMPSSVVSVAFSLDGRTLASGSWDETIRLWDIATGQQIQLLDFEGVTSVIFSPDGKTLASGSALGFIRFWDLSAGQKFLICSEYLGAFSPNGKTLVSWSFGNESADKTIRVWDPYSGQLLRSLKGHTDNVRSVAFSPDGRTLASGSDDHTIRLWNTLTGQVIWTLEGHKENVSSVAFSPDGKTLASGSWDSTIRLWNTLTSQVIQTLEGHAGPLVSVAFSPDGKTLASGSDDNTVRLWDLTAGEIINTQKADSVGEIAFTPDGKTLLLASRDLVENEGRNPACHFWDISEFLDNYSRYQQGSLSDYLPELERQLGLTLEGTEALPYPYGNAPMTPQWSKYHPFHWLPKAEAGDTEAMRELGLIYTRASQDQEAIRWLRQAAQAGDAEAQRALDIVSHSPRSPAATP